ncbi:speckle-type POZ protein B-like isoform X1 [Nasonia vitripennis]|uniref:BTB domain-containing protein n=1 Tax=Nasonia vitripennis TaxID=7425 RepID=A0A7M7HIH2_NASVI|nr:speckle-type POZ protein B-like isoform X1 [Nasonia vitripennis]XP_008216562.1 speckle-type POZ protein B-like isoform X1 [Nasonia vitripennis]
MSFSSPFGGSTANLNLNTTSRDMFGVKPTTSIFSTGIFADTTTSSFVKSENNAPSKSSATASTIIFATTTTNGIFGANAFAPLTTTSTTTSTAASSVETAASLTTTTASTTSAGFAFGIPSTSAGIVATTSALTTATTFGEIATITNGNLAFGQPTSTASINNEQGMPSTSFAGSKVPRRFRRLPFADINRPITRTTQHYEQPLVVNNLIEEAAETKQIGQLGVAMSSYIWKIPNFSDLYKSSKNVSLCISPAFKIGVGQGEKRCSLYLYPFGSSARLKEYVSVYIECQNSVNSQAQISFSILDADLQIANETFSSVLMTLPGHTMRTGCSQFIKRDTLLDANSRLLSNDTLTLVCHVSLRTMDVRPVFPSEMKINSDFGHLLESEKFSDLILEVEYKELQVHKSVLAARSPTFHKMFEDASGAANEEQNKLKLTDIKYEVMKQILLFIYTEKVEGLTQLANELLVAAHRFKLEDLKTLCEESLFKNLDVANVIDAHVLAETYDSKWLKDKTTDFIIDNAHRVINTSGYKSLADSYPRLLDELFCEMVRRKIIQPIETPVSSL